MERKPKRPKGKRGEGKSGGTHYLSEAIIRVHWWVEVEGGVKRNALERRLDALLDLLMIKPLRHEHSPLERRIRPAASAAAPSSRGTQR
jgi:hypothetical protein